MPQLRAYSQLDLSGGLQNGVSHLLRKRNEVAQATNANFNKKIGSVVRRDGYEKVARTIVHGNDSLGAGVYKFGTNSKVIVGINNQSNTNATLQVLDTDDYWTTLLSNAQANTRFQAVNFLKEYFIAGCSDNSVYLPLTNIDSGLNVSTSHNVYKAPLSKFIIDFQGGLYAANVMVDGVRYRNRVYPSSPAIGPITFIQTDQKGLLKQLRVDATTYLKVGMQIDIYGAGTEAKKQSAITIISVNKKDKRISFADTQIDVSDNDEIWLTGTKNSLSIFWNTDDPTPQDAVFYELLPGKEAAPEITGWGKNNNRLLFFTKNSFYKFDGANMIQVSDTVGCVSHETIQNIGPWTLWLHNTGVWGYNDNSSGEPKLLSRSIQPYIDAINQTNLSKASAGVSGRVYKVAVGELLPLDSVTTSTSTSSTSTSSTSSSTSSTSTSSTSTSSTSLSTSSTSKSTSTSSTSTSTSSTSTSSTSVSTSSTSSSVSTSTSSTTTTTAASSKEVIRLCYDFDMNAWWVEEHRREIRFQFNHTMHGYTKLYFTDDTGRLFRDETTNLDNADPIPMELEMGRTNFGTDQKKNYLSVLIDSEKARGATIQYQIDGGNFITLGQITEPIQKLIFPQGNQLIEGRDISYKFVINDTGEPPVINGLTTYYSVSERLPNETG